MRRTLALLALLAAVAAGCKRRPAAPTAAPADPDPPAARPSAPPAAAGHGTFTVGKSTTHVTGPLDAGGFVDYPAALNARLARGVTPDTNANVLFVQALGPRPEGKPLSPEYLALLGAPAPPEGGAYFVKAAGFEDELARAMQLPWAPPQCPRVAAWLARNEGPLAVVAEGAARPGYFNPLVPGTENGESLGLLGAALPTAQAVRGVASAFVARAMLAAGRGYWDAAWADLQTCHRLARHVARGGMLIEGLVGAAVETTACRADVALLDRGRPDARRVAAALADLLALPPLLDMAAVCDLGERFMYLDLLMNINRQGPGFLARFAAATGEPPPAALAGYNLTGVDWNPAFEAGNALHDRLAAAFRGTDRPARLAAWAALEGDIRAAKGRAEGGALAGATTPKDKGRAVGDILQGVITPAGRKMLDTADRARQTLDNTRTAFALVKARQAAGLYPAALAELAPAHLPEPPADVFSGRPPVYRPGPAGFLLYSVGPNGTDDGGRGPDAMPPADDVAVQLPVPDRR